MTITLEYFIVYTLCVFTAGIAVGFAFQLFNRNHKFEFYIDSADIKKSLTDASYKDKA